MKTCRIATIPGDDGTSDGTGVRVACEPGGSDAPCGMSPKGRPEGEYRSAQHEGSPVSPKGRPEGRVAQCAGARSAKVVQ